MATQFLFVCFGFEIGTPGYSLAHCSPCWLSPMLILCLWRARIPGRPNSPCPADHSCFPPCDYLLRDSKQRRELRNAASTSLLASSKQPSTHPRTLSSTLLFSPRVILWAALLSELELGIRMMNLTGLPDVRVC